MAKRNENTQFWEKYGAYIMIGSMMIIVLISTAYNSNKFVEASENLAKIFDEKMNEALEEQKAPGWLDKVMDYTERKDVEANAPPS